jgi:hypothetical protein
VLGSGGGGELSVGHAEAYARCVAGHYVDVVEAGGGGARVSAEGQIRRWGTRQCGTSTLAPARPSRLHAPLTRHRDGAEVWPSLVEQLRVDDVPREAQDAVHSRAPLPQLVVRLRGAALSHRHRKHLQASALQIAERAGEGVL